MFTGTLLFFDISGGEIFLIIMVVFLVFGPRRLPELAKKVGKGIFELKRATSEIKREITIETNKIKNEITKETKQIEKDIDLEQSIEEEYKKKQEAVDNETDKNQKTENNHEREDLI